MKSELNKMKIRQICRYGEIIFSILESADKETCTVAPYYFQLRQIVVDHYATREKKVCEQNITSCIARAVLMLAVSCLEDGTLLAYFSALDLFTQLKPILMEQLERRK